MFASMAAFYEKHGLTGLSHSRIARYEILWALIESRETEGKGLTVSRECYRDVLMYDLYLRENAKSRPAFARDQTPFKEQIKSFFRQEEESPRYLLSYKGYDSRQMAKMAHIEVMSEGTMILFDYKNRDPLTYNARAIAIPG